MYVQSVNIVYIHMYLYIELILLKKKKRLEFNFDMFTPQINITANIKKIILTFLDFWAILVTIEFF